MVSVSVMGSTGSIGSQTLDIIRESGGRFTVEALGVGSSVEELARQVDEFSPEMVVVADASKYSQAKDLLAGKSRVLVGNDGLSEASATADVVINGVMGFAGLSVTMSALEHGKRLGLANKESLIAAGPLVQIARQTPGAELLPVDSEHCALHQCLRSTTNGHGVDRLVLTASGGPFRGFSKAELASVTVESALSHPTWSMGPKITIDSSTLMNKGLEVIEAHELYGTPYDRIDVVVHPQSIVHSMVAFSDGATIAQLSEPDMRLCIAYSLNYPERSDLAYGAMDWSAPTSLTFEPPDRSAFRCLDLAFIAGQQGGTAPAWLSACNEVVVDRFIKGLMPWTGIADSLEVLLEQHDGSPADSLEAVLDADVRARDATNTYLRGKL